MKNPPSVNGANGATKRKRNSDGTFAKGNAGGPGNPRARQTARLREEMLGAVKLTDMRKIVQALVERAKGGDVAAAREVLDRCVGKPRQELDVEMEVEQPSPYKDLDEMTDLELAEEVDRMKLPVPTTLRKKMDMVKASAQESKGN